MQKNGFRLAGLMFFQLFVLGSYSPVISTYLKDTLKFSGTETGIALSLFQFSAMVAPLAASFFVDRIIASRVIFGILHLAAAALAVVLSFQTQFVPFLILFVVFAFFIGPTSALVNSMTFARMADRSKFGQIRLWGTAGWIAAAWVLALVWQFPGAQMSWMFYSSAVTSVISVVFALVLPRVEVPKPEKFQLIPRESFKIFLKPEMLKLGVVFILSSILDRYYFLGTSAFLTQLGYGRSDVIFWMTLGQITEIFMLLVLSRVLKRLSFRTVLNLGLGMQFLRFLLLWTNIGPGFLLLALSLNGFVYAFFYVSSTIYIDGMADQRSRGGVHQLINLIFYGTSSVAGSLLVGASFDWFKVGNRVDYGQLWLIPVAVSVVSIVLTLTFFKPRYKLADLSVQSPVPDDVN